MSNNQVSINVLQENLSFHMNGSNIFDIPEGRHKAIIEEFYSVEGQKDHDEYALKLKFAAEHLKEFTIFLERQGKYQSQRYDAERQARLEPERMKHAIRTLTEMGFRVTVVDNTEINFEYKEAKIKYFPYSGWATGKTIKDGRGFTNLINQVKSEEK